MPPLKVADELLGEALESHIADLLYSAHYVFGAPRPLSAVTRSSPVLASNAGLVRQLIAAYRGADSWLPSFEDESDEDLTLWGVRYVKPELYSDDPSRYLPTVLPMRSPGYVLFFGDRGPSDPERATENAARVYWNISQAGAAKLVSDLTGLLNDQGEPFQFKIVHSSSRWPERADTAVLYLPATRLVAQWKTVLEVYEGLWDEIRPWTPAFTRRLAPGLAVADDPPGGLSFGQTMARILAKGLAEDHAQHGDRSTTSTRSEHMRKSMAASGRELELAHLNPGSRELEFVVPLGRALMRRPRPVPGAGAPRDAGGRVERRVEELADLIADVALTHGGRCTWLALGADADDATEQRTTGAALYDGLSGIALFLAHAHAVIGRGRYAELAEAAGWSTLDQLSGLDHHHGLYGGRVGAVAAVAEVGATLGRPALLNAATSHLLAAGDGAANEVLHHDLVYGLSGTVLAYCWAARAAGPGASQRLLLAQANTVGEYLANRLVADLATGHRVEGLMPGLAHGPSSSVLGLAVLSRLRGGSVPLARATVIAADYERRFLDAESGTWPGGPTGLAERRFNWCYGAPGVAIARSALLGGATCSPDFEVAVRATVSAGPRFLGRSADPSACHGKLSIAGTIGLVAQAAPATVNLELMRTLLDEALDHYTTEDAVRLSPGLMAGAAGAGLTALCDYRPGDVPSPLFPLSPLFREAEND